MMIIFELFVLGIYKAFMLLNITNSQIRKEVFAMGTLPVVLSEAADLTSTFETA